MSDWTKLKVTELKVELKRRGLAQAGLKAELVARLEADDEAAATRPQADGDGPSADQKDEPREESADRPVEPESVEPTPSARPVELDNEAQEPAIAAHDKPVEAEKKPSADTNQGDVVVAATEEIEIDPEPASHSGNSSRQAGGAHDDSDQGHEFRGRSASNRVAAEPASPNSALNGACKSHSTEVEGDTEAMASDIAVDALKRKRRSASPTPKEDSTKRRRAQESAREYPQDAAQETSDETAARSGHTRDYQAEDIAMPDRVAAPTATYQDVRVDNDLAPAVHRSTSALYINNLMRPLREIDLQNYLVDLAAPSDDTNINDVIERFYLDTIRTHAYVVFNSTSTAVRVRNALHGQVWPRESNRKALFVDFVPVDKVDLWIETEEERIREKRTGSRWEVVYQPTGDGDDVEALLQSSSTASSSAAPPSARTTAAATGVEGAPTGPRGYRPSVAPPPRFAGPPPPPDWSESRDSRPAQTFPGGHPRSAGVDGPGELTMATPAIYFETVPVSLARRRLQDMRSFYSRDPMRLVDREINRYSFQDEDQFVNRGKEVFEGIRPPHRQQAIDREMRGGWRGGGRGGGRGGRFPQRGGPPPYRPHGGDSYMPGTGGPVDDRGPRFDDRGPRLDDRGPRLDDRGPQFGDDDERRW